MPSNSSIKLKDIESTIGNFCPIRIYYNDKIIWDDDMNNIISYKDFWWNNTEKIIYKFTIEIVHFHHSVVKIWGE